MKECKLSYEKKQEFLKNFILIGKAEREVISCWFVNEILMVGALRNFDKTIETALEIEHDFWLIEDVTNKEALISDAQNYECKLRKASKDELVLWGAYNIAKGKWKYCDVSERILEQLSPNILVIK